MKYIQIVQKQQCVLVIHVNNVLNAFKKRRYAKLLTFGWGKVLNRWFRPKKRSNNSVNPMASHWVLHSIGEVGFVMKFNKV